MADYILDLGPEGGDRGGTLVAQGTPEEVCMVEEFYTGQFLKRYLEENHLLGVVPAEMEDYEQAIVAATPNPVGDKSIGRGA